jgi:hypothetical protein
MYAAKQAGKGRTFRAVQVADLGADANPSAATV